MFAKNIKHSVYSFDFKGHGDNSKENDNVFSKQFLIEETIEVLDYISSINVNPIVLVGHSMGGSIATFVVEYLFENKEKYMEIVKKIKGLIVIDVSEGTAKEALPFMESIVLSRPNIFNSIEEAVEFYYKQNIIQSLASCKVSIPPMLVKKDDGKFHLKVDLLKSKSNWVEWFEGLTKSFLNVKIPKLLVMAGPERMDKELTIAHMQGKFKLINNSNVGHFMHEDNFLHFSEVCKDFAVLFKIMNSKFSYV